MNPREMDEALQNDPPVFDVMSDLFSCPPKVSTGPSPMEGKAVLPVQS
jgi:hypothetical protein